MSSSEKPENEKKFDPPSKEAFGSKQIDLFRTFLCKDEEQLKKMSNAIPLWDCLPLYSISRQAAGKMQKAGTFPKLLNFECTYLGRKTFVEIQPARLVNEGVVTEYFPGANEQLIEDALRKIATLQNYGFYENGKNRSGVSFTIYQLREELKKHGHSRSHRQIVLSLRILARSSIEISAEDGRTKIFDSCAYFRGLSSVSRSNMAEDPDASWYVEFHPLITRAINDVQYRQFDYESMMSHKPQLARWLHKYFIAKFTNASLDRKFKIRFSTIKRVSGLLEFYERKRDAIKAIKEALNSLASKRILQGIKNENDEILALLEEEKTIGTNNEIVDVEFTVFSTVELACEAKRSNTNKNIIEGKSKEK